MVPLGIWLPQAPWSSRTHPQRPCVFAPHVMYIWVQSQLTDTPQVDIAPQASPSLRAPHAALVQHAF